jgi:hypothetical protein
MQNTHSEFCILNSEFPHRPRGGGGNESREEAAAFSAS